MQLLIAHYNYILGISVNDLCVHDINVCMCPLVYETILGYLGVL